jgi:L-lactate dehydrogenase (cytochrome)
VTSSARYFTIDDLRREAHRVWPPVVRGYVDGGADGELSLKHNLEAFAGYEFHPRALAGVPGVSLGTTVLGRESPLPLALAPTGYSRMMHPDGEPAVVRAAGRAGVAYTASTMATTSLEDSAAAATRASSTARSPLWFQLYLWTDRGLTRELVSRAGAAGYDALVLTVDCAVTGNRVEDIRRGLIPPAPSRSIVWGGLARHPRWTARYLRGAPLEAANLLDPGTGRRFPNLTFDPALSWDDVARLRADWPGKLLLKGPLNAADAQRAVEAGVDGLVLSNHGGRQLDQTAPPLNTVAAVREQVGDAIDVLVDSGIRRGSDIAIALALGADAVLVGRPYVYGLGAAGEDGVDTALRILVDELVRTMLLLGVADVKELRARGSELVRRR